MNNAQGKHYGKSLLFIAATFLVLCVWLLREYSLPKLWELILGVRPGWILAAVGLMVLYWLLEAGGLHLAVRRFAPDQQPGTTFCATMIGQFFNCVTPFSSGGQPMQAFYLMKRGMALSFASCSLMIKFIVYQFVLTIYSAITLFLCFKTFTSEISAVGWLAFVGFGGNTGFLQARVLRERDHGCRIILLDDTQQFAVQGVRIHCTDFILRPVEFRHIVRSMGLATGGGMR